MAKILEFRIPKRSSIDQYFDDLDMQPLAKEDAADRLITQLVCYVMPMWIKKKLPFRGLEMLTTELRSSMIVDAPEYILRRDVDILIEELEPIWKQICEKADDYL